MIKYNNNKGFTLVEILVSLFIFSLLSIALSGIYIAFTKAQNRTYASQKLLNDMQYSMEIMAREIRNNEIMYFDPDCDSLIYNNPIAFGSCILLKRENGSVFAFATTTDVTHDILHYLELTHDDTISQDYGGNYYVEGGNWENVVVLLQHTKNNADINFLKFDISPSINPYYDNNNEQPKVTIGLGVEYVSEKEAEQISHFLQTTVSSRIYRR